MLGSAPPLDRAEAYLVAVPFRLPFVTSVGVIRVRISWILRLRDRDGREGFGEIALDPAASDSRQARLRRAVVAAVSDLATGQPLNESLLAAAGSTGIAVLAGMNGALEALSRSSPDDRADPVGRQSVAVNATIGVSDPGPAAEAAARAVADGFSCIKLKAGPEGRGALVARVGAVRGAVGPLVHLRLDANASWSYEQAVDLLNAVASFDIEYVEQPFAPAVDFSDRPGEGRGHAALRQECAVPIALDESVSDEMSARVILAAHAADVLVVKPARVGGPGVVRAIAEGARAVGVPVVISSFFETGIGLDAAARAAASLPEVGPERAHGLATAGMLVHDLLASPATVTGGRMMLQDSLAVDEAALRRFTIERVGPER